MLDTLRAYINLSWSNIKICYELACQGEYSEAIHVISDTGNEIFYLIGFGFAVTEMLNLAFRKDLKPVQKILPIIGIGLGGLLSLAAGVILFSSAVALLPFLVIANGGVNFLITLGRYYQQTAQFGNLQQEFKTPSGLLAKNHFTRAEIDQYFEAIKQQYISETPKEKRIKSLFKEKYGHMLKLIEKKQQLHFLRKNIPRRVYSILFNAGAVISTLVAAVVVIPLNLWIYGLLATASIGLRLAAIVNETRIGLRESLSQNKINQPKKKFLQALFPEPKTKAIAMKDQAEDTFWNVLGWGYRKAAVAADNLRDTPKSKTLRKSR